MKLKFYPFQSLFRRMRLVSFSILIIAGLIDAASAQVTVSGALTGNGSYTTLGAAITAIGTSQSGANITITITANTTEGAATISIGAGTWASLQIVPSGGARTITAATTAGLPMIDFNGADNVTINGNIGGTASLTIANTTVSSTSGTSTIRFQTDATNNTVTYCNIQGSATMANATNGGNIWFGSNAVSSGNDNNTISFCNIGPAGTNLPSKCIYFSGTSNTNPGTANSGILIDNNNIFDYFSATSSSSGIDLNSGSTNLSISNNKFYQTATRTQTTGALHAAIQISNINGNSYQIIGNTIGYSSSAGTGNYTFAGVSSSSIFIPINLSVGTTTASSVQGNTITNIAMSGAISGTTNSASFRGINVIGGLVNIGATSAGASGTGNTIGSLSATGAITVSSSSASAMDAIAILNWGSSNWIVRNNSIGGITVSNSSTGAANLYGIRLNTSTTATTTIQDNTIGGAIANSLNSTSTSSGTVVAGIFAASSINTINGNTVRNMTAAGGTGTGSSASVVGIHVVATSNNHTVSGNTIFNLANTHATAATWVNGINFSSSTGTNLIARNFVHSLSVANAASTINGIYMLGGTATFQNNMVRLGIDGSGNGITAGCAIHGIWEAVGTDIFAHNSVYVGGTGVASSTNNTFAFRSSVTLNTRSFRNNIFSNERSNTSTGGKHYAVTVGGTAANPSGLSINYNIYRASGVGGVLGLFNSADVISLTSWRTAVGQDANSWESDPQFLNPIGSASAVDLHLNPSVATQAEGQGILIAGITDDFDGQTRSTLTPVDIGADAGNFTSVPLCSGAPTAGTASRTTASVCVSGSTNLSVNDPNQGLGITIQWYSSTTSGGPYTPLAGGSALNASSGTRTVTTFFVASFKCTNTNDSTLSNEVIFTVFPSPAVMISPAAVNYCSNTPPIALTASGASTYVWSPGTGLSGTTGASVTTSPSVTTTYTVTGTSANNCTATATTVVTALPNFTSITATANPSAVCNGNNSSLSATAVGVQTQSFTGGVITISSGGNASPYPSTINVSGIGTISSLKVTITNFSHVFPNDVDMVLFGPTGAHSIIFTDAIGTASVTGRNYTFQAGATALPATGSPASGTYDVNSSGTFNGVGTPSAVSTRNLGVFNNTNANGTWSLFVFDDVSGDAGSIGSWSIEFTYTTPVASYTWSPADFLNNTSIQNPTAQALLASTTYTVIATAANGCSLTATTTVVAGDPLVVNAAAAPATICSGRSTGLSASVTGGGAPFTYNWSDGTNVLGTTASLTTTPLTNTIFTVTVTDACGAEGTATVSVTVNSSPVISVSNSNPILCTPVTSSTLTASGADTYAWSPAAGLNATTGASVNSSPSSTTNYTVIGTSSANGCTTSATQTVTKGIGITSISAAASPPSICAGGTSSLNATAAAGLPFVRITEVVLFNTGTGAGVIPSWAIGSDFIEITNTSVVSADISGWRFDDYANNSATSVHPYTFPAGTVIPSNSVLVLHLGSGTNNLANRFYNTGGTNDSWNSTSAVGYVLRNGTTVVDAVGTGSSAYTFASSLGITATDWSGFAPIGSGFAGCRRTAANDSNTGADFSRSDVSTITLGVFNAIYNNPQNGTIASYSWSPVTFLNNPALQAPTASLMTSTTTYTVTATEALGCTATATVTVVAGDPLVVTAAASPSSICTGGSTSLSAAVTGGGTPYTYAWSDGVSSIGSTNPRSISPPASGIYTVTVTDACGSSATATVSITVVSLPAIAINNSNPILCSPSTSSALTASGADTYVWSPAAGLNATTGSTVNASPSSTTIYTVIGTVTATGCSSTATQTVTRGNSIQSVSASATPASVCVLGTSNLNVTATVPVPFVRITEIIQNNGGTGTGTIPSWVIGADLVEITNTSTIAADISGWRFDDYAAGSAVSVHPYTFPAGTIIPANSVLVLHLGPGTDNLTNRLYNTGGTNDGWLSSSSVGYVLRNGATVVDAVGTGSSAYTFASGLGVTASDWSGFASAGSGLAGTRRTAANDSNTGADFVSSSVSTITMGVFNAIYNNPLSGTISSYSWSPATFLNNASIQAPRASLINATTTYTVTLTEALGCSATATVTIAAGEPLTVSASASPSSICSGGSASLSAAVSGGGPPYAYVWSDGLNSIGTTNPRSISPQASGIYTVTVTDACGSTATSTLSLTVIPPPPVSISSLNPILCGSTSSSTLSATGADTYVWSPSSGLSATTGSTVSSTVASTTIYTVIGTVTATGCTASATATITRGTPIANLSATANPASVCINGNSVLSVNATENVTQSVTGGAISIPTIIGTASPYPSTINVTGVGTINSLKVTITNFSHDYPADIDMVLFGPTGVHSIIFTDAIGTSIVSGRTYTFQAGAAPLPATGLPVSGTYDVANRGAYSGSGTPAAVSNTGLAVFNGTNANGTWTLYVYDDADTDGGSIGSWSIEFNSTVPASATYAWSPSTFLNNTTLQNPTASSMTASTTYTVTATNISGCTASSSVTVNAGQPLAISASALPASVCAGSPVSLSANVTGGGQPYSYDWSDGLSSIGNTGTLALTPTSSGTYTLTVTDACGAAATTTVSVIINTNPTVSISGPAGICAPGTVTLTASGAVSYLWSTSQTINPIFASVSATSIYTVTGTAANGCTGTASFTVVRPPATTVTALASPSAICPGGTSQLNATASYPPTSVPSYCTPTHTNTAATSCVTSVSINTLNSSAAACIVPFYRQNAPTGSNTTTLMPGTSYTVTVSSGTAIVSVWIDFNRNGVYETSEWVQPYTNAASGSATINVPLGASPGQAGMRVRSRSTGSPNSSGDACTSFASGSTEDYVVTISVPISGTFTYSWSPVTGLNNASIQNPQSTVNTSTLYTVIATDAYGCTGTATVSVNVNPLTASASATPTTVCAGANVTLTSTVSGGGLPYTYSWSDGSNVVATTANPIVNPNTTSTYTLTLTDACGTTRTASTAAVNVNPIPGVSVNPGSALYCPPTAVALTASSGITGTTFAWTPAAGLSATTGAAVNASPTSSTTYTVTATRNSCTSTATVSITTGTAITVDATADTTQSCSPLGTILHACVNPAFTSYNLDSSNVSYSPTGTTTTIHSSAIDDAGATVTLPFSFNFYGNSYTAASVSSNGYLLFGGTIASATSVNNLSAMPSTSTNNNSISLVGCDLHTRTDGRVESFTVGTAPNRRFVVRYSNVRFLTGATTAPFTSIVNGQIALHEGTGIIEVRVDSVNSGTDTRNRTLGIENSTGTAAVTAPGKNNSQWNSGPRTYRFTPAAAICSNTGMSFAWTPATGLNNASSSDPSVAGLNATTIYTLTATNASGCSAQDTVSLIVFPQAPTPIITASGPLSFCPGGSVTLTSSNTTTPNNWSTGATTQSISVNTTSTITLTAQGSFCPSAPVSVDVVRYDTIQPLINVDGGGLALCDAANRTLTADGGPQFTAWNWNTSATTQAITISSVGTYGVSATDLNGCLTYNQVTFVAGATPVAPVISTTSPLTLCSGTQVTITSNLADGLTWDPTFDNTQSISYPLPPGIYSFSVTRDSLGCTSQSNILTFNVNATPQVTGYSADSACIGEQLTINGADLTGVTTISFNGTTASNFTVVDDNTITVTVPTGATTGPVTLTNSSTGCSLAGPVFTTKVVCGVNLSLKVFLEGYCLPTPFSGTMATSWTNQLRTDLGNGNMGTPTGNEADLVMVSLYDPSGTLQFSDSVMILNNGTGSLSLPSAFSGNNYYILISHRSHVSVRSAGLVTMSANVVYDFTTSESKADNNGSNSSMVELATGEWAMWVGDVSRDGFVGGDDVGQIDNDNIIGLYQDYLNTDVSGDGFVGGDDVGAADNNNIGGVYYLYP